MSFIAILSALFCCTLMFIVKREYKAGLMIVGTLVFSLVRIPYVPFHNVNILLPLCFLLSEAQNIHLLVRSSRGKTVWKLMGLAILMGFITILSSKHLHDSVSIRFFLQGELFFKYFALLYVYWAFSSEDSIKPTLKITFVGVIILTAFGILNYLTKSADFVSAMMSGIEVKGMANDGGDVGQMFAEKERFRVQAMFINPFDYGYICILMLLLHIYGYVKGYERKWMLMVVAACAIFGIVSCGCRTNIFCCMVGVAVFFLLAFKLGKTIRLSLLMMFVAVVVYQFVPSVQEVVDNMMTMFEKNSDVGGSSMELRTLQYAAVLYHVQDNPLFGCGYQYFIIDMGWGDGVKYLKDTRLAGLEGVAMSYILERGLVGFALYLLFYISIIISFFRNRKYSMVATAFGISVVCTYLSFANMTGELSSVYPTLLLLGYVLKVVDYNKVASALMGGARRVCNFILAQFPCRIFNAVRVCA